MEKKSIARELASLSSAASFLVGHAWYLQTVTAANEILIEGKICWFSGVILGSCCDRCMNTLAGFLLGCCWDNFLGYDFHYFIWA